MNALPRRPDWWRTNGDRTGAGCSMSLTPTRSTETWKAGLASRVAGTRSAPCGCWAGTRHDRNVHAARAPVRDTIRTMGTRRASADVDEYVAAFPPAVRAILQRVRRVVRAAAPGATEVISYRMPALKQNGILVYFAAFKNHIGFYPPIQGDARLERAASRYAGKQGDLQFHLD